MFDDVFKIILSSYALDDEVNNDSIGGVFEFLYKSTSKPLTSFPTVYARSIFELHPKI